MKKSTIKKSCAIAVTAITLLGAIPAASAATCNTAPSAGSCATGAINPYTGSCITGTTSQFTSSSCWTGTTSQSTGTTGSTSKSTSTNNSTYYTAANASKQEQQMLAWINEERAANGLAPYQLDSSVSAVARAKSQDMITNRYFAHQSPTLGSARDMLKKAGISFLSASENIARYGSLSKAHVGLMSSPGHRNSILSRTSTHVGIGIVQDSSGNYYITQIFIRK